jgi:hypothetical protein
LPTLYFDPPYKSIKDEQKQPQMMNVFNEPYRNLFKSMQCIVKNNLLKINQLIGELWYLYNYLLNTPAFSGVTSLYAIRQKPNKYFNNLENWKKIPTHIL